MIRRAIGVWLFASALAAQPATRTRNVVLVVTDGLRWQEVFGGADSTVIFGDPRALGDTTALRRDFWRPTADERRRTLLPFIWDSVAGQGQIFGNREAGSIAQVTNGLKFSYPGYHEMLAGWPDPRIDRNDFGPNPNLTVFDWLGRQQGIDGRVAAFGTWGAFADIFNRDRGKFFVHAGWESPVKAPASLSDSLFERLYRTTFRTWDDNAYDAFMQASLLDYLRTNRPRVLFVGYGETDEWAHAGRYDRLLRSARLVDDFVAELWRALQSIPEYRGTTSLIITTDHGRGSGTTAWRNHGKDVDGAENIWVAVIGPDTPPLGERRNVARITQAQIAATMAAILGFDYPRDVTQAAPAITDVLRGRP
jgi:hypothetical protein